MKIYGEGIYETRPWIVQEEGTTYLQEEGSFIKTKPNYVGADIRYTATKDGQTVYAFTLAKPENVITLSGIKAPVKAVSLLGWERPVQWERVDGILKISFPISTEECSAYGLKISLQ
ncbi:MAG: alpha-L-fucosidase C-terminal domain-containing protein [Coraliomargaritaceae bacterium]